MTPGKRTNTRRPCTRPAPCSVSSPETYKHLTIEKYQE
jgi:hypothetical protein